MITTSKNIFVFRKRLLLFSETFIADQSAFLPHYQANLLGFQSDDSGLHLLKNSPVYLLQQNIRFLELFKVLHRNGLMLGKQWFLKIKEVNAQLIHAHFLSDGMDALAYAKYLSIPIVTTLHGHDITKKAKGSSLKRNKDFFNRVDRVIAVSDFIAQHALKKGCPESKLIRHSIGIDMDKFTGEKQETDSPSILFVGRLVEKKGVAYLLDAISIVQKKIPDIRLTIIGDGRLRSKLELQTESLGIKVDFVGKKSAQEIKQYLLSHWLFAVPSITAEDGNAEGLGMVFLEAQSLKTPVVSFSSGGVVEAIENEVTGLLCPEKDVACLAEHLTQLISDRSLRIKMGDAGRERVNKHFNIKRQCLKLESIYDNVIANG